jgi:hypothetical protein
MSSHSKKMSNYSFLLLCLYFGKLGIVEHFLQFLAGGEDYARFPDCRGGNFFGGVLTLAAETV